MNTQDESPPLDVESTSQAMTVRQAVAAVEQVQPQSKPQVTAAQAKIEAVAQLTMKAYDRASMLALTPEESAALQADFPDDAFQPGAAGKENLIYIEHAHLRDRLNKVFGLGQWAIVPRNRWAEDFRTYKGVDASRVYVEAMLLVRGCFVSEAVGDMVYYKNNESQNYGDAVEGAKTAALRRCVKELGVGLQAWKKEWCIGWWQRRNGKPSKTTEEMRQPSPSKPSILKPNQPAPETFVPVCTVKMVTEKQGESNGKAWTAYFVLLDDGVGEIQVGTFSKTVAEMAKTLSETGEQAEVTYKPGKKPGTFEIVNLLPKDQPPTDIVP